MSASASRELAREGVSRVRERSAFAHETIDALLVPAGLDVRDSAFASRLAFGTIACRGTLDEAVARHVNEPAHLENRVADCLATSAYELLFMRTPARAAVSEGVELVKSVQPRAAGLANAVLRRLAEEVAGFPWGDPATDRSALARLYGHPEWLATLLCDELGAEAAADVMAANNEPAPLFMAMLPFKQDSDVTLGQLAESGADPVGTPLENCVIAGVPRAAVTSTPLSSGNAIVADAGAQLAALSVPLTDGGYVAELGAGRGTKSLLMAARAARQGTSVRLLAVDLHAFKLAQLEETAALVGASGISTLVADAAGELAEGMPRAGSVDAVLVDAPCTGLGTLRRHPDRRWRALPAEIDVLADLGAKLLRTAAVLVKPGGFVVYSTCTITRRENDEVVDAFLASEAGTGFRSDDLTSDVPDEWRRFVTSAGRFQSLPEPGGLDGHFVARLVRG